MPRDRNRKRDIPQVTLVSRDDVGNERVAAQIDVHAARYRAAARLRPVVREGHRIEKGTLETAN